VSGFGWGVVGLGRHTRRYIGPAISASSTGYLAAVCTSDPLAVGLWGQPRVYERLTDLLADPAVDGVFLVSPNHVHRDQVVAAAAAGKHVLCEKPLGTTTADCQEMVSACQDAGVALGVGYHLRHNAVHIEARRLVMAGVLGDLRYSEIRYAHATAGATGTPPSPWRRDPAKTGGGAFMGTGVHAVDLLRFITGREIANVAARSDRHADGGVEQLLAAVMDLDDGSIATVLGGNLPRPLNEVVISGTTGTLRCTGSVGNQGGGILELSVGDEDTATTFEPDDVYIRECDAFVESVLAGRVPDASGIDGLWTARIVDALYSSAASGQQVQVTKGEA
jgi:1,5-anhydro-D-fructose reductase (1,5-anhydro-D-mannitol-forming)